MPIRWMLAGILLLALRLGAVAGDALYAPDQEIPILSGAGPADSATAPFQLTIDPLVTQRAPGAAGALADSADEHVDLGWHAPIFSLFTVGYDTGVNAFRQDQTIWDDEGATSQVSTAFISRPSIQIQTGTSLAWTDYVQTQRSFTDGLPGFSDATKYGTQAAWTPIKDVTTVKIDAGAQQTYNFNRSILDENLYTGSLDQKLPYIPFTLHTAGSIADDTSPSPLMTASNSAIVDASLLWKIVPSASWTGGVQRQDTRIPSSLTLQNTNTWFTQLSLQATQSWTVTMGLAYDQKSAMAAGQFLSAGSDDMLSLGLAWKFGDRFNAGAGLNYRVLQSQTPAPTLNTPPATISLSAGGSF